MSLKNILHEEKNKALYFPYINVPKNEWFTQMLLYWDEISTIVPQEFIHESNRLDRYMMDLVDAKLVKPISPYIGKWEDRGNFTSSFISLIEKYKVNQKAKDSKFGPGYSARIHVDKFGTDVTEYLIREKLARPENYPWFRVETVTAGLFMTYLACYLAKYNEENMQPITDDIATFATFSDKYPIGESSINYQLKSMRMEIMEHILPVPQFDVSVGSIVKFKEKHGKLLPKFRNKIESKIKELSFVDNLLEKENLLQGFVSSVNEETKELAAKMKTDFGNITFGTICGLSAAAIPGARAIIERDLGSALEAIPGVIGAVYAAYKGSKDKQLSISSSPYAYAAYAQAREW